MAIETYTRKNIYSKMLKSVIIRCDYAEITNLKGFVDLIKPLLRPYFGMMLPIEHSQYEFSLNAKKESLCSPPIATETRKNFYRFLNYIPSDIDVKLDVSSEFICIDINCDKIYQGSEIFTDIFCKLVATLRKFDSYALINRIGIRKIDLQTLSDGEKIEDYFNENYIVGAKWNDGLYKNLSTMTDLFVDGDVAFNITQRIDRNGPEKRERLIYDVDSYITGECIEQCLPETEASTGEKLKVFLNDTMQEKMFKFFLNVVSESYLKKSKLAKEAIA